MVSEVQQSIKILISAVGGMKNLINIKVYTYWYLVEMVSS